jgi:hypothetical protein
MRKTEYSRASRFQFRFSNGAEEFMRSPKTMRLLRDSIHEPSSDSFKIRRTC